jgi:hypothetical protein
MKRKNNPILIHHPPLNISKCANIKDLAYDERGMPHFSHFVALEDQSNREMVSGKCEEALDADGNDEHNFFYGFLKN